jgi:chorismate mutase
MNEKLNKKRKQIQDIDVGILEQLASRFEIIEEIGEIKELLGMPVEDLGQEANLFDHYELISLKLGVKVELAKEIFNLIIEESKKVQGKKHGN